MHKFSKVAAAAAATGLAVLGTVAAGGGVANAATNQSAASCSTGAVVLEVGVLPSCQSGTATVLNPTGFTLTTTTSSPVSGLLTTVTSLLSTLDGNSNLLSGLTSALTESVSFTLSCNVGGQTVTQPESYSNLTDGETKQISLKTAVGSPVPNSCKVEDFTVHSPISLSLLDLTLLNGVSGSVLGSLGGLLGNTPLTGLNTTQLSNLLNLSVSATVTADTATPGAIWAKAGTTKAGNTADICADAENNGNAGAAGQVYQCNSDLAQYFVQASTGQLVHNGECLAQNGTNVQLSTCNTNTAQVWDVKGTGGNFNTIVNKSSGKCLTWPSAKNFTQLKVGTCTGKAGTLWTGPAKSAV